MAGFSSARLVAHDQLEPSVVSSLLTRLALHSAWLHSVAKQRWEYLTQKIAVFGEKEDVRGPCCLSP